MTTLNKEAAMCVRIIAQLKVDPQVSLGKLESNAGFQRLLVALPELFANIYDEPVNLSRLMKMQFDCIDFLIDRSSKKSSLLADIRNGVSEFDNAETFLWALGVSEEDYCMRVPGMTKTEFATMKQGDLMVGYLLQQHPAVVLAPLLRKQTRRH